MPHTIRLAAAFLRHYLAWLVGWSRTPRHTGYKTPQQHNDDVSKIRSALATSTDPVVLRKNGIGHEARRRPERAGPTLDLRALDRILAIDPIRRTAIVEPQVTMAQLVAECGRHGLAPPVVPEFPEITVGGAVQGLAAESSSHRWGLFHESVEWLDVVLGDGSLLRVSNTEHPDLFSALPGSYGSLAVVTLVKLELVRRTASLIVHHRRMDLTDFLDDESLLENAFLDAVCDRGREVVVTTANPDPSPSRSLPTYRPRWYGRYYCDHVMDTTSETGPEIVAWPDYLFRYDRGAFWIAPTKLGRSLTRRLLWGGFAHAANLYRLRLSKQELLTKPSTRLVQDCIVPVEHVVEFLDVIRGAVSGPLWLLPIVCGAESLFGLRPGRWLNVGIYVRTDLPEDEVPAFNRRIERVLARIGGRKTLHADLFCTRQQFDAIYDMDEYERLRSTYRASPTLASIHEKLGISDGH
jgi:FAD/FMN-containing dehydrogenase